MKKLHICILAFILFSTTAFAQRKYVGWSTGYHTTWGSKSVTSLYFKAYTHLVYFPGSTTGPSSSEGKTFTSACHSNNTKAIICLGGSGQGNSFTSATTSGNLANFISTSVSMMQAGGFDGIDIDWEDNVNSSQFQALIQQLSAALAKISPKPLLTIATGEGLAQYAAPVADYADQLNLMSYYDYLTNSGAPIPSQLAAFTSRGVAKDKLGVGFGYGSDNEVDGPNECGNGANGNPTDVNAKCLYTADSGFGGLMVWDVDDGPASSDSITAYYVNKNATSIRPMQLANMNRDQGSLFSIANAAGEIRFSVPIVETVDLELFTMNGGLVRNLAHGVREPGVTYSVLLGNRGAGVSVKPGAYIVRFATPSGAEAGMVVVK